MSNSMSADNYVKNWQEISSRFSFRARNDQNVAWQAEFRKELSKPWVLTL